MTDKVIVFDFETTGLSPNMGDRPTEIAAVVIEGDREVGRFQSLMNPERPIPPYVQSLTGITDSMVKSAPSVEAVMREFRDFCASFALVAHNAAFDRKFLDWEYERIGHSRNQPVLCSMRIARRVYPNCANHKLGTLVDYANIPMTGRYHRAQADADVTAKLWVQMKREIECSCGIRNVSLDLLEHIQSVPCAAMHAHVRQYLKRCGQLE